ncbi:MAG: NUDIX hydrolase [Candidatus Sungbacteria bacterium]|nr:NUDIX hydrolase [Candidatus Sungbacteria bacterium]
MKRDYGIFHVALKILLRKGDEFLFLRTDNDRYWDWPGGRIDNVEMTTPLERVLAREVREELGKTLKYKLGRPILFYRRWFAERRIYIFSMMYEADWISGDIKLSFEHNRYEWINPKTFRFRKKDFFSDEEYDAVMKYFKENGYA